MLGEINIVSFSFLRSCPFEFYAQNFGYIAFVSRPHSSTEWMNIGGQKRHRTRKRSFKMPFTRFHKRNMVCVTLNDYHGKWFRQCLCIIFFLWIKLMKIDSVGCYVYMRYNFLIRSFIHSFIQQNHLNQLLAKCTEWMAILEIHLKYLYRSKLCEKNTDIIFIISHFHTTAKAILLICYKFIYFSTKYLFNV